MTACWMEVSMPAVAAALFFLLDAVVIFLAATGMLKNETELWSGGIGFVVCTVLGAICAWQADKAAKEKC